MTKSGWTTVADSQGVAVSQQDARDYWVDSPRLLRLAELAAATGESLDQLYFDSSERSFSAKS